TAGSSSTTRMRAGASSESGDGGTAGGLNSIVISVHRPTCRDHDAAAPVLLRQRQCALRGVQQLHRFAAIGGTRRDPYARGEMSGAAEAMLLERAPHAIRAA